VVEAKTAWAAMTKHQTISLYLYLCCLVFKLFFRFFYNALDTFAQKIEVSSGTRSLLKKIGVRGHVLKHFKVFMARKGGMLNIQIL